VTSFTQALAGILPDWRHLCDRRLPLWGLLGPRGRSIRRLEALKAALSCGGCRLQPRCRRRIVAGVHGPARHCPNAALFFGRGTR
jgi:hypothetical protein